MPDTPNATPTNYNSAYTGPQIDASVGAVLDKEDSWDEAVAGKLPAGGEAGQVLEKTGAEDNAADWRTPPFLTRRNLLDNWYFVGGGSQLGDGVFPINQRGQTSYTGAGIGIDRWRTNSGYIVSTTLTAAGATFSNEMESNRGIIDMVFGQRLNFSGKTICVSMLTTSGDFLTGSVSLPEMSSSSPDSYTTVFDFGTNSTVRVFGGASGRIALQLVLGIGESISLQAIKLELGEIQTLAHQENGVWVLNELPDYAEELAKCQRYYLRITNASASIPVATGYASTANSTTPVFYLPTPVPMAKAPTVSFTGNIGVYPPNSAGIVLSSITRAFLISTGVALLTEITSAGPQGGGYVLRPSTGTVIELSAE